jgi:hypothetical protein
MALGVQAAPGAMGPIPNQPIGHAGMSRQMQQALQRQGANGHQAGMNMAQNLQTAGGGFFNPITYIANAPELIVNGITQMPTGQLVGNYLTGGAILKYKITGIISAILLVVAMSAEYSIILTLTAIAGPPFWAALAVSLRTGVGGGAALRRVIGLGAADPTGAGLAIATTAEVVWVMYVAYRISAARRGAFARQIGVWWDNMKDFFGF